MAVLRIGRWGKLQETSWMQGRECMSCALGFWISLARSFFKILEKVTKERRFFSEQRMRCAL